MTTSDRFRLDGGRPVEQDGVQRIGRERFVRRVIAFHRRHAVEVMPLQAALAGGSGQMWQCRR